tara:strand:- start:226 stop:351 length:126 start_codon:yes stop_codon:yes gene_type:complete
MAFPLLKCSVSHTIKEVFGFMQEKRPVKTGLFRQLVFILTF